MGFLRSIPIASVVDRAADFPEHWICRSLIEAEVDGRRVSAPGFGVSRRKHRCVISSFAEAHEHFWSQPTVQHAMQSQNLALTNLRGEPRGQIGAEQVVGLSDGRDRIPRDATGIAFGRDWHEAAEHGLLEVIERHLLCMAWLGELELARVRSDALALHSQRVSLSVFCPVLPAIPLAIALIDGRGFLALGAKCSTRYDRALSGAIAEAVMLHNAYKIPDDGSPQQALSRHRKTVELLRSSSGRQKVMNRFEQVANRIIDPAFLSKCFYSSSAMIEQSGLSWDHFEVATFASGVGACVRVLNQFASNPRQACKEYSDLPLL